MEYAALCNFAKKYYILLVKSRCVGRVDKRLVLMVFGVVYFDVFFWETRTRRLERQRRVVAWIVAIEKYYC